MKSKTTFAWLGVRGASKQCRQRRKFDNAVGAEPGKQNQTAPQDEGKQSGGSRGARRGERGPLADVVESDPPCGAVGIAEMLSCGEVRQHLAPGAVYIEEDGTQWVSLPSPSNQFDEVFKVATKMADDETATNMAVFSSSGMRILIDENSSPRKLADLKVRKMMLFTTEMALIGNRSKSRGQQLHQFMERVNSWKLRQWKGQFNAEDVRGTTEEVIKDRADMTNTLTRLLLSSYDASENEVSQAVKAVVAKETAENGLALRVVIDRYGEEGREVLRNATFYLKNPLSTEKTAGVTLRTQREEAEPIDKSRCMDITNRDVVTPWADFSRRVHKYNTGIVARGTTMNAKKQTVFKSLTLFKRHSNDSLFDFEFKGFPPVDSSTTSFETQYDRWHKSQRFFDFGTKKQHLAYKELFGRALKGGLAAPLGGSNTKGARTTPLPPVGREDWRTDPKVRKAWDQFGDGEWVPFALEHLQHRTLPSIPDDKDYPEVYVSSRTGGQNSPNSIYAGGFGLEKVATEDNPKENREDARSAAISINGGHSKSGSGGGMTRLQGDPLRQAIRCQIGDAPKGKQTESSRKKIILVGSLAVGGALLLIGGIGILLMCMKKKKNGGEERKTEASSSSSLALKKEMEQHSQHQPQSQK